MAPGAAKQEPFEKRIRPWLIAFIVLPISVLLTLRDWVLERIRPSAGDADKHDERVGRIVKQMRELHKTGRPVNLRTDRDSADSHSLRITKKDKAQQVRLRDLNCILGLDASRGVVRVEPGVTVGKLTTFLVERNLQLEATLEMEDATLGGLALSQGMTTHSHVCGLVADTVESFEFVGGDGELRKTTRGDALHRAMMFSHGALGVLVALELRVVPAERFVEITYTLVRAEELSSTFERMINGGKCPFFLEAIIYSKDKAVVIQGDLTRDTLSSTRLPVNRQGEWWREWYFKRVERSVSGEKELMPMRDYLMRHDRSMCMTMETVFPIGNEPWFRYLFGWTLPPKVSFLKASHTAKTRVESMTQQVYQDVAYPLESFSRVYSFVDSTFGIYPLLCYPCRVFNHDSMIKFPLNADQTKHASRLFMNFGIYGIPAPIKRGDAKFPMLHRVRELEALIRDVGGFQHTYCDTLQTREEFERMFDHSALESARAQVGSTLLPSVYDKVKPELDVTALLKQEVSACGL